MFFQFLLLVLLGSVSSILVPIPELGYSLLGTSYPLSSAFLRVPYALPPVQSLRFRPPSSPYHLEGIYDSREYPPACLQPKNDQLKWNKDNIEFSEDCLYLSIWMPNKKSENGSAVLFWVHDGDFIEGGAAESKYEGRFLAENKDIVVVVVQYRLGPLGFAALNGLKDLNFERTTGNYGLLDQIAALNWVRRYISSFGGNPNKITVGGGTSACLLGASPLSYGLFSQMIWHSSECWSKTKDPIEAYKATQNALVGLCEGDLVDCLMNTEAQNLVGLDIGNPMIDGYVLGEHPFLSYNQGDKRFNAVLMGNVMDEGSLFVGSDISSINYNSSVENATNWLFLGEKEFSQVFDNYPCYSEDCSKELSDLIGDSYFSCNEVLSANWLAETGTQVYTFVFSHYWEENEEQMYGAYHGIDIPFVFHTVEQSFKNYTEQEIKLSDIVSDIWGDFINGFYSNLPAFNSKNKYPRLNITALQTAINFEEYKLGDISLSNFVSLFNFRNKYATMNKHFSPMEKNPFEVIYDWKTSICHEVWFPSYSNILNQHVKNNSVANLSNMTILIPGLGQLQGLQGDGFESFLKVPYAEPPVKDLRWAPTVSPRTWNGTFDATDFPDPCPQSLSLGFYQNIASFNEDCLYLSIWKPKNAPPKGNPVVVWIHGGSLMNGRASDPDYDGEFMAKNQSILFISIQYRLGIFGFLGLPEFEAGNKEKIVGNYGLLDQLAALQWVKRYCSMFGGDPDRITVAGESAGASSILYQLMISKSNGLFSQVIIESSAVFVEILSLEEKYNLSKQTISGICNGSLVASCLRQVDVKTLLSLPLNGLINKATLDGVLISQHPLDFFENWKYTAHGNISAALIGNNLNEGTAFVTSTINSSNYVDAIKIDSPWIKSEDIITLETNYPCFDSLDCSDIYASLLGDNWLVCPTILSAIAISNDPNIHVFSYLFAHPPESVNRFLPFYGAYHGAEIAYAFNNVPNADSFYSSRELLISKQMFDIWSNFIIGNFSEFPEYTLEANYPRFNFTDPNGEQIKISYQWKEKQCQQVWQPIYSKAPNDSYHFLQE